MSQLQCIRAVIFDAVGTLIHPVPSALEVYAKVGQAHGSRYDVNAVRGRFTGAFARQEAIDRAARWRTDEGREWRRWRDIVREVLDDVPDNDACFRELYDHFSRPEAWRVEVEASAAIAELHQRGLCVGIASNYDHRLRSVVAGLPELVLIDAVVISSEVGWRKPARQFFDAVAAAVGCGREELVVVGDDLVNDFDGAAAAGCRAVLFDPVGRHTDVEDRVAALGEVLACA